MSMDYFNTYQKYIRKITNKYLSIVSFFFLLFPVSFLYFLGLLKC